MSVASYNIYSLQKDKFLLLQKELDSQKNYNYVMALITILSLIIALI